MPSVSLRFTPEHRTESIYQYVAFDVPHGVDGITITMTYTALRSVVDLGLFDPFGHRGWSGGSRSVAMITQDEATPGYIPGELHAGTWFVALGLHQIENAGVDVQVSWEFGRPDFPRSPDLPKPVLRRPSRGLPVPKGYRWFPADFHTHSQHSDGDLGINELACLAAERGLEVLAITDHNTVSHHPHLPAAAKYSGINVIAGQEVTTNTGHANALGQMPWVDFRQATDEWLASTIRHGGLFSINHPVAGDCAWLRDVPLGARFTELWHSSWDRYHEFPIRWWQQRMPDAIPIGGSDFHRHGSDGLPGEPTTWVMCATEEDEVTQDLVLEALNANRISISGDVDCPVLVPLEDSVVAVGGEGCVVRTPRGAVHHLHSDHVKFPREMGLFALQSRDDKYQSLCFIDS